MRVEDLPEGIVVSLSLLATVALFVAAAFGGVALGLGLDALRMWLGW